VRPEGLGKLIKIIHLIGFGTLDLPEFIPVPHNISKELTAPFFKAEK
jgi:hypothetical protein